MPKVLNINREKAACAPLKKNQIKQRERKNVEKIKVRRPRLRRPPENRA